MSQKKKSTKYFDMTWFESFGYDTKVKYLSGVPKESGEYLVVVDISKEDRPLYDIRLLAVRVDDEQKIVRAMDVFGDPANTEQILAYFKTADYNFETANKYIEENMETLLEDQVAEVPEVQPTTKQ